MAWCMGAGGVTLHTLKCRIRLKVFSASGARPLNPGSPTGGLDALEKR